jgi:hypothetical protein
VAIGPEGRYRLVRRIAAGGMGEVWEADDTVLGRRVVREASVQLTVDGRSQGAPGRSGQVWRGRFVPDGGRDR